VIYLFSFHPLQKKNRIKVTGNLSLRNPQRLRKFKPLLEGELHCGWVEELVAHREKQPSRARSTALGPSP